MELLNVIMNTVGTANTVIGIVFAVFYIYQIFYIFVPIFVRKKRLPDRPLRRYGVLVSARNEGKVIGNLIDSLKAQTYDAEHITVFVLADNCTDNTADIARSKGAVVYERHNTDKVGKGYALEYLYDSIADDYGDKYFDAYAVFDADNVVDSRFFESVNRVFSDKYPIVTSYRNTKNYGANWISAGYGLWFLRESQYLNRSRMRLNTTCAVSGTGFVFDSAIMRECGGWKFFLLTEDIEFTNYNVIKGRKIGYAIDAITYDEQPTKFSQSCSQRMRWAKGYVQVMGKYGFKLIRGIFSRNCTSCFDMACTILPALVLSIISLLINVIGGILMLVLGGDVIPLLTSFGITLLNTYGLMFTLGAITTVTEWKKIHTSAFKKILYAFTFPIFMMTYVPISLVGVFTKGEWKPIEHSESITIDEINRADGNDSDKNINVK